MTTVPSQVPQFIFYLSSQATPEAMSAASSILEGTFYSSLRASSQQASRFVNWVRESAVSRIHEIQMVFNTANLLIVAYSAKQLADEVRSRFQFSVIDLAAAWKVGLLPGILASWPMILTAGAAMGIGFLILFRFTPDPVSDQTHGQVTISQQMILQQKIAQALHLTKLVLHVALACVAKNRFWLVVGLIGSGYSFLKNKNIQWLNFSREFPVQGGNADFQISRLKVTYNMLALKPEASNETKACAICLVGEGEGEQLPNMAFCANHVFHRTCMSEAAATKGNGFANNSSYRRWTITTYSNGAVSNSHHYLAFVPENNFPKCPLCNQFPLQNNCEIDVTDAAHGTHGAYVFIQRAQDDQPFFEKIYAVYNTAQACLSYLQQYPELAAGIYGIQKSMIALDILGLLGTAYYLQKRVAEKLEISEENMTFYRTTAAVTLVALGALSYFAILQLNAYLQSALVLKDLLAQLEISPAILSSIDVQWASAVKLQVLYLTRLTMSIALAFFSKQRLLSLWNAATQAFSFGAISQLKWVEFSQGFSYPLKKVFAEGGTRTSSLNEWTLPSLTIKSEFIVNASQAKDPSQMKSVLKSIYGYMSKVLDKSAWDRYWYDKQICYSVALQNNSAALGLTGLSMSGWDAQYGTAAFNISR